MKDNQECIYYLSGDTMNALKKSPFLDRCKKHGLNVLLMDEAIDEYLVQQMREFKYDDKVYQLQSINREGLTVPGEDVFQEDKGLDAFCKAVKEHYGDTVEKIKQTNALGDLHCSIVSSAYGWSANMERIMKAQALRNDGMSQSMNSKKIVELNVQHPLIVAISAQYKDENKLSEINKNILTLMLETSMLSSGYVLDDPHVYCKKIFKVMSANIEDVVTDIKGVVTDNKGVKEDVTVVDIEGTEMEQVD
jgi:molecular chaperone HtpG